MGRAPSVEQPSDSSTILVEEQIGAAYGNVRLVALNIDAVSLVALNMTAFLDAAGNVTTVVNAADAASASATAAAASATAAANSATAASASATTAGTSETNALSYKNLAESFKNSASASAIAAATAETDAEAWATAAAASATTATTKAGEAAASATAAANSNTAAGNSATAAAGSATAASNSATAAAASAVTAQNAATSAISGLPSKANLNGGNSFDGNQAVNGYVTVSANPYGVSWDGSYKAATEDAVYDKIQSLLLAGGAAWGTLTGTLSDQADLIAALNAKLDDSQAGAFGLTLLGSALVTDAKTSLAYAIADISGLQGALDSKANLAGGNAFSGNQTIAGTLSATGHISADSGKLILNGAAGEIAYIDFWSNGFLCGKLQGYDGDNRLIYAFDTHTFRNANQASDLLTMTTAGAVFSVGVSGPVVAYGAGWNGSALFATQDAIYDEIETLKSMVVGAMSYKGTWNATTNSPAIPAAATGNKGWFYKVATAGTTAVDGIAEWAIGDWIVSNGTAWDKIDNTESVSTVNGQTGAVVLNSSHISESGNLYFTEARARDTLLTGLSTATGGAVSATDSIIVAFGRIQNVLTAHVGAGGAAHADVVAAGASGFMTGADKTKLNGIATGATANDTDANLKNRANHTGSQAQSTITNLTTDLAAKADKLATIVAKTATYTIANANNNEYHTLSHATGATVNLFNATAGTTIVLRNIAAGAWAIALNGCTLFKNGATASAAGSLANGGQVTLICWGSSVWTASGSNLT